jgi:endonuclease/exonuclease/phosphatase family metal-dependent hydrolase
MRPHSPPYRLLTQRLIDAQAACQDWRAARTFPSLWPITRIDHVFVSRHFKIVRVRVPRNELTRVASDHLPLIVDLELLVEQEERTFVDPIRSSEEVCS